MESSALEHYFLASPGILGVRTTLPNLKWSFGINMPSCSAGEFESCALRLDLQVVRNQEFSTNGFKPGAAVLGKYHYFSGAQGEDKLLYRRPFLFSSELLLEVSGLVANKPSIRVNPTYYKYVSHRFMNLHSVGYIMTDITALELLRMGYVALHCSAFRVEGRTVVVFAPPNTGKTLTTMTACMDHGADFLAEDLGISDGSVLYPVPWTSTFRYYSKVEKSASARVINTLTNAIPFIELISIGKRRPVTDYIDGCRIAQPSQITDVVLLERGQEEVSQCTTDEILAKLVNLNRFEFWYSKSPLITAYEYFNPELDVAGAIKTEQELLRKTAENACQRLVVRASDPARYASLILGALG
jgi:hypothetical protein